MKQGDQPNLQSRQAPRIVKEVLRGPEEVYRNTHHKRAERRPQAPECDDSNHSIARFAEVDLREDAQVLQQDGQLGEPERSVVNPDRRPKPHSDNLILGARKLPYVLAHTELGLLVGRDAECDREDSGREDEGIVGAGLLCDECASAEPCDDSQTRDDREDYSDDVEG